MDKIAQIILDDCDEQEAILNILEKFGLPVMHDSPGADDYCKARGKKPCNGCPFRASCGLAASLRLPINNVAEMAEAISRSQLNVGLLDSACYRRSIKRNFFSVTLGTVWRHKKCLKCKDLIGCKVFVRFWCYTRMFRVGSPYGACKGCNSSPLQCVSILSLLGPLPKKEKYENIIFHIPR